MKHRTARTWRCLLALAVLASCNDDATATRTRALFDLSRASQELYAIPYPNDIRVRDDGTIDLAGSGQDKPELVQLYLKTVSDNRLGGFGSSAVFFRFRDAVDPQSCGPRTAADTMLPGSSIFLVNIDRSSADYNTRVPVTWKYVQEKRNYIGPHSLALLPMPGFALEPGTTHAAVITEGLCDTDGDPMQPDVDLNLLLDDDPPANPALARAHAAYAPLRDFVREQGLTGIVSAAVFTTGQPTAIAGLARAVLHKLPAPTAVDLEMYQNEDFYLIEGTYQAPNFQSGTPPYMTPESGGVIALDASGNPKVARDESIRFALSIPREGAMPTAGWPIVLYAHGTGGDYRTFIGEGVAQALARVKDDAGSVVTRFAVASVDQVLHGSRAPNTSPAVTFFNLQNPAGSVHNVVQGGIDYFSLLRMIKGLSLTSVPWSPRSGRQGAKVFDPPFSFDPDNILFMGHSQGGLTGAVFVAYEPDVGAAVLSGAGGSAMLGLLNKTRPISIPVLLRTVLGEGVDELHPMVNLLQQMLETADTANYGRVVRDQRKHVLLTQGFVDHHTPNVATDALALAIGLPLAGPVVREVPGLDLLADLPSATTPLPVAGNLTIDGAAVTRGLRQYPEKLTSVPCTADTDCDKNYCVTTSGRCAEEGHWVVFHRDAAIRQYSRFLATAVRDKVPTIVK